jgi:hypothetical protein
MAKKKRSSKQAKQDAAPVGQPPVTRARPVGISSIKRDFAKVLLFTFALLAAKMLMERTVFGQHFEMMTYDVLQLRLLSTRPTEDLPLVIVDINDLETAPPNGAGDAPRATPRRPLRELLNAIADQQPRAIGIDIDFSPDNNGYITAQDPEFFQFCLDLKARTHIPLFLGIARSQALPPGVWLGSKDYAELATSITVPRENRKMLRWIQVSESAPRRPTISAALADAFQFSDYRIPRWLGWAVRRRSEKRLLGGMSVGEFLVDYSSVETLEKERLRTKDPRVIADQGWLLRDKVVIIGDATRGRASDTFVIPGRQEPFPGIYAHACAVQTLINAPLYELTDTGRLIIDPALGLIAFSIVVLIRLHYRGNAEQVVSTWWLHHALNILMTGGVVIVGAALVHATRLMWNDFLLVGAVLLLHQPAEHIAMQIGGWLREIVPPIWRRLIFDSEREEPR